MDNQKKPMTRRELIKYLLSIGAIGSLFSFGIKPGIKESIPLNMSLTVKATPNYKGKQDA